MAEASGKGAYEKGFDAKTKEIERDEWGHQFTSMLPEKSIAFANSVPMNGAV